MEIHIVTPEGSVLHVMDAVSLTLPTEEGIITVLEGHVPLMTMVTPGEVFVETAEGEPSILAISRGVLQINRDNTINLLADTAERAEDIDIERAEAAKKRAEELKVNLKGNAEVDYKAVQTEIEKELARIKAGERLKEKKSNT